MAGQSKFEMSPWGKAVAGASGAVLANALVYPLDMYANNFVAWVARTGKLTSRTA